MTKKDYILIANAIHQAYICLDDNNELDRKHIVTIVDHLAPALKADNINFDMEKFAKACGL